jgi:hypothetical protein
MGRTSTIISVFVLRTGERKTEKKTNQQDNTRFAAAAIKRLRLFLCPNNTKKNGVMQHEI